MRLLAQAVAERTGRAPDDPGVRALAGAVIGVGLSSMFAATADPGADIVSLIDEAMGSWRQAFRWIPSIVIKRPEGTNCGELARQIQAVIAAAGGSPDLRVVRRGLGVSLPVEASCRLVVEFGGQIVEVAGAPNRDRSEHWGNTARQQPIGILTRMTRLAIRIP